MDRSLKALSILYSVSNNILIILHRFAEAPPIIFNWVLLLLDEYNDVDEKFTFYRKDLSIIMHAYTNVDNFYGKTVLN